MRYADLIALYFERSNALQSYWTVCVLVIGGLLAVAALRPRRDVLAGVLASILYCAFAYKNLSAMPPAYDGVHNFHISCDVMALAILWALQWRRHGSRPTPSL
jgi:hypothetical protein